MCKLFVIAIAAYMCACVFVCIMYICAYKYVRTLVWFVVASRRYTTTETSPEAIISRYEQNAPTVYDARVLAK